MATRQRDDSSGMSIEHGPLEIRTERDPDGVHVVELHGELDLAGVDALTEALLRVEATDARQIVVDLCGLEFIDSTGLVALSAAHERSLQDANRLVFRRGSAPAPVARVLELTQVDRLLPFAD